MSIVTGTYYQHLLTSLSALEDCASRSLVKGEIQDKAGDRQLKDKAEENDDAEERLEDEDENEESSLDERNPRQSTSIPKSTVSEYLQNKQKNIEELKKRLDEVKAKHPKEHAHSDEPVVRQRNKDDR